MPHITILSPLEYENYSKLSNIPIDKVKSECDSVKLYAEKNNWTVDETANANDIFVALNPELKPELKVVENSDFLNLVDKVQVLNFGKGGCINTYIGPPSNELPAVPIKNIFQSILDWMKTKPNTKNVDNAIDKLEECIFWLSK
jgi:hypothetical protein